MMIKVQKGLKEIFQEHQNSPPPQYTMDQTRHSISYLAKSTHFSCPLLFKYGVATYSMKFQRLWCIIGTVLNHEERHTYHVILKYNVDHSYDYLTYHRHKTNR